MQKHAILALIALIGASSLEAQYDIADPPLNVRWSFAMGPSGATSSGRTARLTIPSQCFSCQKVEEVVSGADQGEFHGVLTATGVPGRLGLALRVELMFNRSISNPYIAPPPTCKSFKCDQPRKAEDDQAIMFTGALDYAPLDARKVTPYVSVGGGVELNRLKWRQDSSAHSALTGHSIAFGPFFAVGGGVRATFGEWAAFIEWRTFTTFETAGAQMTPLSLGFQHRPHRAAATSTAGT